MHDGSLPTLHEVVEFYNRGGNRNPNLSPRLVPLGLSRTEVDSLVAFLETLNGEGWQDVAPRTFPRRLGDPETSRTATHGLGVSDQAR